MIPHHFSHSQPIPFLIIPLNNYFPNPTLFWTYNQSQLLNFTQSDLGERFMIEYSREQINVIEPKFNRAIKQPFEQSQKNMVLNQTSQKPNLLKSLTTSLPQSRQFNLMETGQEGITEKLSQEKQIQKRISQTQKQVSVKLQFNTFKQNSQQIHKFELKPNNKTPNDNIIVKTEAIEVQLQKTIKQSNNWKRTILPNMYQVIFAYLTRRQKSQNRVKRFFDKIAKPNKKMSQNYSLQRYFQYQTLLRQKLVYCVNEQKFGLLRQIHDPHCSNFQLEQQMFYNRVSRMVVRDFIEKELIILLLHKERTKQTANDGENEFYQRHMEMYRRIKSVFKKTFTI